MSREIKETEAQQPEGQDEQGGGAEGISPQERQRLLAQFESRIDSGDFEGRPFHNIVREELYPLLGEGDLEEEVFSRLVRKWASKNYPYDWPVRSYQDEA